ncbi:hypothetical protein JXI42_00655 [bacterium]|nr:hypothetical protein [bacterium]
MAINSDGYIIISLYNNGNFVSVKDNKPTHYYVILDENGNLIKDVTPWPFGPPGYWSKQIAYNTDIKIGTLSQLYNYGDISKITANQLVDPSVSPPI